MGYPLAFLQRRDLLKVLYDGIPDKSKVHTSKRVCNVDHTDSGVIVHCEDGSKFAGDIVVGADGIHSAVRSLMQKHIEISNPGATKKDSNSISAEYNCIFGLGNPVEGIVQTGDCHRGYAKDQSTLAFIGRGGKLYWFLFTKLDKKYFGKDIPKYTKAQMEEAAKTFYNIHMTDTITFDKVWEQRTIANMCCVEESLNEHWTSDRFVCLGDSIHKVWKFGTNLNLIP
jgi:2-polyprenyl-6-methoxyphenol hydroxylase-like FAD-dependent oxidoreductase